MNRQVAWQFDKLLQEAVEKKASDLHFSVGLPPILRLHGELIALDGPMLNPQDTETISRKIMDEKQVKSFVEQGELDLAYSCPGLARFRVNIYRQRGSTAIAMRVINTEIPSLNSGAARVVERFAVTKGLLSLPGLPVAENRQPRLRSSI